MRMGSQTIKPMTTSIVIVDRYPIIRDGLAKFLNEKFVTFQVLEYVSVAKMNQDSKHQKPALIILGINNTGLEMVLALLDHLRMAYPESKIIVYDDERDSLKALEYLKNGARGYIPKSEDIATLQEGIGIVLDGKRFVVKEILDDIFDEQIFGFNKRLDRQHLLTGAELEVANYLINGMKISSIASLLHKSVSTVSTFKKRIFDKLGVDDIIELNEKITPVNYRKMGV
jgi:two-component system invasion response regulator UvrY